MEKCYLLHVNLGGKPSKSRIAEAAQQINTLVAQLSPDHQLAYTSGDGSTFGFFLKSSRRAGQIAHRINSPVSNDQDPAQAAPPSPLRNDDSLLVMEIGEDVSMVGKTRDQAWFQYHRPTPMQKLKASSAIGRGKPQVESKLASELERLKGKFGK
jgi:hypothetical protein